MRKIAPSKRFRNSGGFSLVEVALAMGIVSFAMVSLMGMLPIGLASFKLAMTNTIESQIVQSLSNDLLLANFSAVSGYNGQTYYYDNQGQPLTSATGAIYRAKVSVGAVSGGTVTGSSSIMISAASASKVTVTISNESDKSGYTLQHPHQYSVIIANNGL